MQPHRLYWHKAGPASLNVDNERLVAVTYYDPAGLIFLWLVRGSGLAPSFYCSQFELFLADQHCDLN